MPIDAEFARETLDMDDEEEPAEGLSLNVRGTRAPTSVPIDFISFNIESSAVFKYRVGTHLCFYAFYYVYSGHV